MDSFINFCNKQIHFITHGYGDAIVLLHGFLESLEIWTAFSNQLSKEFQVICIDLPGHGKSDSLNDSHSMDLMADAVKAVLKFLEVQSCTMIGHSMGGYVTLAFAEKYPENLMGFGLFHSQSAADSEEAKTNRDRTIQLIENDRMGFIQLFIPDLFAPDNRRKFETKIQLLKKQASDTPKEGIIAALKGMKERPNRTSVLKTTKLPILYILGQEDARIPVDVALYQAREAKRCEVQILKNVGHMGYIEDESYTMNCIKYFALNCFSNTKN